MRTLAAKKLRPSTVLPSSAAGDVVAARTVADSLLDIECPDAERRMARLLLTATVVHLGLGAGPEPCFDDLVSLLRRFHGSNGGLALLAVSPSAFVRYVWAEFDSDPAAKTLAVDLCLGALRLHWWQNTKLPHDAVKR